MKLIEPKFEIIEQEPGLDGIYEAIEKAGRTCYKSIGTRFFKIPLGGFYMPPSWHWIPESCYTKIEGDGRKSEELNGYVSIADKDVKNFEGLDKYECEFNPKYHKNITAKEFVDRMIKSGHGAMLEFGTVYLAIPLLKKYSEIDTDWYKYAHNKYSKIYLNYNNIQLITTNYRVLVENNWLDDLKYLCEPTENHEKRICVRFTTDRGVSHELVRHRVFSFAQESSRYCSYNKDKFGNELTFIIPTWSRLKEGFYATSETITPGENENLLEVKYSPYKINENNFDNIKTLKCDKKTELLISSLKYAEYTYLQLIDNNSNAQEARQVLPNALKTEINMCGFVSDWKHFFELRDSKAAHPDMQALAKPLHEAFIEKGLLSK